jgi:hypothetical protein
VQCGVSIVIIFDVLLYVSEDMVRVFDEWVFVLIVGCISKLRVFSLGKTEGVGYLQFAVPVRGHPAVSQHFY